MTSTSGVKVTDEVNDVYDKMRLRHQGEDLKERLKFVRFKIKDGFIHVDEKIKMKDVMGEEDIFKKLISYLTLKECCYACYDCSFTTTTSPQDKLVFIMWAPDDAIIKEKLVYASSKGAIKKALAGAIEWQLNDIESREASNLLEKVATKEDVVMLEGKELKGGK